MLIRERAIVVISILCRIVCVKLSHEIIYEKPKKIELRINDKHNRNSDFLQEF